MTAHLGLQGPSLLALKRLALRAGAKRADAPGVADWRDGGLSEWSAKRFKPESLKPSKKRAKRQTANTGPDLHWSQGSASGLTRAVEHGEAALAVSKAAEAGRNAPSNFTLERIKVTNEADSGLNRIPLLARGGGLQVGGEGEIEGPGFIRPIVCKCKSWMCPSCRPFKGVTLREAFIESKAGLFVKPMLYTLTVDREEFDGPKEAYLHVMREKIIPRLMRALNVKRWFWVLEIQERTGEGWPHWHILLDVSEQPALWHNKELKETSFTYPGQSKGWKHYPHFLDLDKANSLLKKWGISRHANLSIKKDPKGRIIEFKNPEHAVRYISKYLVKNPLRGYPPWLLKLSGARFYQPSKGRGGIGSVMPSSTPKRQVKKQAHAQSEKTSRRTPYERISECGMKLIYMHHLKSVDRPWVVGSKLKGRKWVATPTWGDKAALPLALGAVCVEDFDFKRCRPFPVWGFLDMASCHAFQFDQGAKEKEFKRRVDDRRRELLGQWALFGPSHGRNARDAAEGSASRHDSSEPPWDFSFRPPASLQAAKAEPLGQAEAETAGLSEGREASLSGSPQGEKLAVGCEHCPSPPLLGAEGKSREPASFESLSKTA